MWATGARGRRRSWGSITHFNMKIRMMVLTLFLVSFAGRLAASPTIDLVWPPEGHQYQGLHSSFVFGSVQPPTSQLTVNGQPISVYRTGAFLAMVPFSPGVFPLNLRAVSDGQETQLIRKVLIQSWPGALPPDSGFDAFYYSPQKDVTLSPGDRVGVVCKGPPGDQASFKVGSGSYEPMAEVESANPRVSAGTYRADYFIPFDKYLDRVPIRFRLVTRRGKTLLGQAPGRLSVGERVKRICEMKSDLVTVTTGPDKDLGYDSFLPKGVLAGVTGSWGNYLRLGFGRCEIGWVQDKDVKILPSGTPVPHSVLGSLVVDTLSDPSSQKAQSTIIDIPLEARHPFKVEETTEPLRLKILLYGVTADMDKVRYKSGASCVKDVRWHQLDPDLCELDILTDQTFGWGYDVRYEPGRMIVEIRHAPPVSRDQGTSLKGLVVAVDAGHSSADPGATGPLRTHEDAINLLVARALAVRLESLGARVVMIRKNDETLDLLQRTRLAWQARAHLFISIHANSIADQGNPLEDNGFSIHYWAPHSRPLAAALHAAYQANIPLNDQGVWYDNLAVCRMTEMPSVLTESAFIIVPEQEAMLRDEAFRNRLAKTITRGIQKYLKKTLP